MPTYDRKAEIDAVMVSMDEAAYGARPVFAGDLQAVLRINPEDVQTDLTSHAAHYAYFATLHADAKAVLAQLADRRRLTMSIVDRELRNEIERRGDKKPPEDRLRMDVETDPRCLEVREMIIEQERVVDRLDGVLTALRDRRPALVEVSMWRRASEGTPGSGAPSNNPIPSAKLPTRRVVHG